MSLIVVSGALANKHGQGGEAWVRLSYVLGLRRLGHRVHFLEQFVESGSDAQGAPTRARESARDEHSAPAAYFRDVVEAFELENCATLLPMDDQGATDVPPELLDLADAADGLLNISGHLTIPSVLRQFRRRVFLDIDPGYTQFWHAAGAKGALVEGHDEFFTIAGNIGSPGCSLPAAGIRWRTTRPPVVLSEWPCLPPPSGLPRFTTVANWRGSYGPVQAGNRTYGVKAHQFRKFLELPSQRPEIFEIALNIHPGDRKDRDALVANGWRLTDPVAAASTPHAFRQYVQDSGAEFSVAQGIYVETQSGWFSDRTTRYLASGRPALVQDSGFSRRLPTGLGLVSFRTMEEAVRGAESIAERYDEHCRAARDIAERHFDSDCVLGQLLEEAGIAP